MSYFHSFWHVKYTKVTSQTNNVDDHILLSRSICGQGFVVIAFIEVKILGRGLYTTQLIDI